MSHVTYDKYGHYIYPHALAFLEWHLKYIIAKGVK